MLSHTTIKKFLTYLSQTCEEAGQSDQISDRQHTSQSESLMEDTRSVCRFNRIFIIKKIPREKKTTITSLKKREGCGVAKIFQPKQHVHMERG